MESGDEAVLPALPEQTSLLKIPHCEMQSGEGDS